MGSFEFDLWSHDFELEVQSRLPPPQFGPGLIGWILAAFRLRDLHACVFVVICSSSSTGHRYLSRRWIQKLILKSLYSKFKLKL